jgi:hypothetical protein
MCYLFIFNSSVEHTNRLTPEKQVEAHSLHATIGSLSATKGMSATTQQIMKQLSRTLGAEPSPDEKEQEQQQQQRPLPTLPPLQVTTPAPLGLHLARYQQMKQMKRDRLTKEQQERQERQDRLVKVNESRK